MDFNPLNVATLLEAHFRTNYFRTETTNADTVMTTRLINIINSYLENRAEEYEYLDIGNFICVQIRVRLFVFDHITYT